MSRVMTRPPEAALRICAWRCRRLPLALTFLPLAGLEWFADGRLQWGLLGASALCGLSSVCRGGRMPRQRLLIALSVVLAWWAAWDVARHGGQAGMAVFLPAGLVAASHLLNRRLCLSCPVCRPASSGRSGA